MSGAIQVLLSSLKVGTILVIVIGGVLFGETQYTSLISKV